MAPLSSIASSGMQAAQQRLQASAHNVANAQTEGFTRLEVVQQSRSEVGGVDAATRRAESVGMSLESEMVDQLSARNAFVANATVFRTADRMAGALLNVYA
ncbi:flagellar basal body protein [Pseudorhodoferax soli]|uniref:Flagellar basal-body rod protein FlgC n=1 Tax=Pseudorhodoferax soli TaxID=545864 RepID=A0A368Y8E9_9BURK|nr:flagellar basal body protein [Pseudorhodoferax soli]RCW75688.1 flagellar basal-body rod protein FlgC [Pseudorhodoferax soli]